MIVVDASFALAAVLDEAHTVAARALWQRWSRNRESIIAPSLFRAETLSGIRRGVYRGVLTPEDGEQSLVDLNDLQIDIREPTGLYPLAWDLAQQYNRPTCYDCCYLALAVMTGCDLWTLDQRLVNSVQPPVSWIRTV